MNDCLEWVGLKHLNFSFQDNVMARIDDVGWTKNNMKHAVEFEAAIQRWQRWKSMCKEFQENKKKHRRRK